MGRPRKNPQDYVADDEITVFRCGTLGGVFVTESQCVYFINGMHATNQKHVIDALRKMAHLGVVEVREEPSLSFEEEE